MKKILRKLKYLLPIIIIFMLVIMLFPNNLFAQPLPEITINVTKETTGSALIGATYNFVLEGYVNGQWSFFEAYLNQTAVGTKVFTVNSLSLGRLFRVYEVENTIVAKYSGVSLTSMPPSDITTKITISPEFSWDGTGDPIVNVYFKNITPAKEEEEVEEKETEEIWVRDHPMTCYRVWINEDNKFQFIFWYPYRDNNWVKIYDMSGKEVFRIDMPYDNPNLIVDLPNGTYTVKTFNVDPATPIQTFVIGKP